jgi:hypothetical protein
MKRSVIFILLSVLASTAKSQLAVTSIDENFNTNCPAGGNHPTGWIDFNPIVSTVPDGQWKCTTDGRNTTGGIKCTNYWSGAFHVDTAYLISPKLNFSSYTGNNIYVRFDAKTTKIHLGGKMSLVATTDSDSIQQSSIELTSTLLPVFGPDDSSDWVTHSINMTAYESFGDFYLAFRFTGTDTTGSTWFLDNIYTTTAPLIVPSINTGKFSINASGSSGTGRMTISYEVLNSEPFALSIYDLLGREVCKQTFTPKNYVGSHTIDDLNLRPGLYFVRMSTSNASRVARAWVD